MPHVATRRTRVSAFVKYEALGDRNYERQVQTLTLDGTEDIGTVFQSDGTIVVAADVATLTDPVWLLVDEDIYANFTTAGDYDVAVLTGGAGGSGAAEVLRSQLKFGDSLSAGQIDTVVAQIESQGISVL